MLLRSAACLLLGALQPLAFAPFFLWPLAILIPCALLWLLQAEMPLRRLFLFAYLYGLGYFGFGVYWIYNSLHVFGQAPPIVAGGITAAMVACLAFAPAICLLLWGKARERYGDNSLWLLPLLWFALEWVKGWILTGMPWLSLGYSQTPSPLAGFAPLVGVYGIGALCILMAVSLLLLLRHRRYPLIAVVCAIPFTGWLLQQVEWSEAHGKSLQVALVQGNIPQQLKWRYDQRQNIFNTYWRETSRHWGSDLIVWPETALPGHSDEIEDSVLAPMLDMAIRQKATIITGIIASGDQPDIFYNSAIQLGPDRRLYHKRHLVMFGEYYPMRWLLDFFSNLINIPYSDLSHGPREQQLMRVGETEIGMSICFEDVFSRDIMLAMPRAKLLINLTNDAWFGDSTAPHQHMQIAQMRSQETSRPLLRATNTGVSAFIDHKGRVGLQSEQFKTETIHASVQGRSGVTPFYYFAKIQALLAWLILGGVIWLAWRKPG